MNSQCNILLEAFKRGEYLTADSAFRKYNISTFSQRMGELKQRGHNIADCWIESPTGKRYKQYWLVAEKVV